MDVAGPTEPRAPARRHTTAALAAAGLAVVALAVWGPLGERKERGDVSVVVTGPNKRGLPRAPLRIENAAGELVRWLVTDAEGRARAEDLPWSGALRVRCGDAVSLIRGPEVSLACETGLPVTLEPFDVGTGEPVPEVVWRNAFASMSPALEVAARDGALTAFVRPGDTGTLFARAVTVPDGLVAWDELHFEFHASRYANRLVVRYPLRREAAVSVRMDGAPGPLTWTLEFPAVAERYPAASGDGERPVDGRLRLRGVPFLAGEEFLLRVTDRALVSLFQGGRVPGSHRVAGRLPLDVDEEIVLDLDPAQAAEVEWPPTSLGSALTAYGGGPAPPGPFEPGAGPAITVRVLRRDGRPAAGAMVAMHYGRPTSNPRLYHGTAAFVRADEDGVAQFSGVPSPFASFQLIEAGLVRTRTERHEVVDGLEVVLREGDGGRLEVRVVDADDRPLPGARLRMGTQDLEHVRGPVVSWVDDQAGIQRIDPFVDEQGRRNFEHVTPGEVHVEATWLARTGSAVATAVEGETTTVTVRVP